MFKRENRKETVTKSISTILMLLLFFVLTFMSVKTLIAYFESKKIKDYDVHFANLEIALYNVNNEEFTSIKGDSVPLNGILPGDTIPINIGKVENKSNTSVYALANLVVTIEPITPRTQTLVLSTWYNLNGDKIKVSNFEKNEIPATKLKANVIDDDGFTINYTLPGNKVTNAYKMGKVSASFGVYGIQSFLPEIENQAREPELEVCEIIVSRLANQEFEEEAYVNLTMGTETGTVYLIPGDESYNQIIKNINRNSCGLYLDEDLTVPIETVYPSGVYDIPEGVNVYTKEATLDKLDFTPTGGTCSVTGSSEITGEVVIPKTYYDEESGEEIAVTKIEASAFAESYMTSLITPEGLLEIEADALKNCPEVTHVKLPDTLTTLGSGAFFGCTKLTDIDLSETQLTSIGGQAFYQCTSLESIVIPETVTTIGGSIFAKCTSLKTCVLPTGLKGMLYATFSDCTSLESITIPEGINILRYDTFKGCSSLKELVIPENVTSLEHRVIAGCTSLKKLTLPSTVTSIHNSCFQAGTSNVLEEIVVTGNGTNFQNINGFLVWKNSEVALATNSAVTVPANMTKMWPGCASLQENRTSIDFALSDATMTTLEYNVFEGCTNLKDIEIPSALTSFGVYCFYQCSSIERVEIPSGVTTIPMHCFRDCKALKEVVLNEGLRTLDLYAFCGAGSNFSLRIILPDSLERIKTQSFNGASIDTIRIPPNVTPDTTSFYQAKIKTLILDSGNALQSFYDPEENSRLNQTVVDDSVWYVLEEIDVEYSTGTIYGALTRNEGETYEWNGKVYCVYTRK